MKKKVYSQLTSVYENALVFSGQTTFLKMEQCIDGLPMFSRDTTFKRIPMFCGFTRILRMDICCIKAFISTILYNSR